MTAWKLKKGGKQIASLMAIAILMMSLTACGARENEMPSKVEETPITEEIANNDERDEMMAAYKGILDGIFYDHVFPDGQPCDWAEGIDISENKFAIYDVDSDGKDELIIEYSNASMAGMVELVYDYNSDLKTSHEVFREFPALTYYDNGIIEAMWSHNQGLAGEFWPYTLYQYNLEQDFYENVGIVDAWDKSLSETNFSGEAFPSEVDADGDGIVYYISKREDTESAKPIDKADYMKWKDSYLEGASPIEIPFVNLTEEMITEATS